jgi:hypothetical protein
MIGPEIIFFLLKSRVNNIMQYDKRDGTCWQKGFCGVLKDIVKGKQE